MRVDQLQKLLDHWCDGIEVINSAVTKDVRIMTEAMRPFADRQVADFAKFLAQCEEYQRTGVVSAAGRKASTPKKASDPDKLPRLVEAIRSAIPTGDGRLSQLLQDVNKLTQGEIHQLLPEFGIAGKPKKAEAVRQLRDVLNNQAEAASRVQTMRDDRR